MRNAEEARHSEFAGGRVKITCTSRTHALSRMYYEARTSLVHSRLVSCVLPAYGKIVHAGQGLGRVCGVAVSRRQLYLSRYNVANT